jgi:FixJ family two-component response regulator
VQPITDNVDKLEPLASEARALARGLAANERLFLQHVLAGHSLMQCAGRLGLTAEEAARAKAGLMRKLNATQTADLVRIALYAGLNPIR